MFAALFFIISTFLFGISASNFLKFLDDWWKKSAFAAGFGFLAATWLTFIVSWGFGILGDTSILFSSAILLGFFLRFPKRKRLPIASDYAGLGFTFIILSILAYLNLQLLPHLNDAGVMVAGGNIWGDYPFHLGIIHSFSERANYPPEYPILINTNLAYPFMINFLSAILLKGGFSLFNSLLIPHAIFYFSMISFLYFLGVFLSRRKLVGVLLVLLFLFNGNFGFIDALQGALKTPDPVNFLLHPPQAFSHIDVKPQADAVDPHMGKNNIEFMNLLFSTFIPQRAAIMGISLMVLFYSLVAISIKKPEKEPLFVAGVILGLLPLVHGHSFLAAAIFAPFAFAHSMFIAEKKYDALKTWSYLIIPSLALSIPQLLFMRSQLGGAEFMAQRFGWMQVQPLSIPEAIYYWLRNFGFILPLAFFGFLLSSNLARIIFVPFLLLFLAGNLYKLSPWDWDTIKVFTSAFLLLCYFAAVALDKLISHKRFSVGALGLLLLSLSIFSSILTLFWWVNDTPTLYSKRDFVLADWVKRNTPADAIWLTSDAHTHVVPSLTGRQAVLGLRWYLYSHGLDKQKLEPERDVYDFFQAANCAVPLKYGAKFAFLGIQEESIEKANRAAFENNPNYLPIFDETIEGYRTTIYKIFCKK